MQDFEGKVAVITGGASGIGFGMAERFAAAGMTVVLADINEDALPEAESRLAERGASALGVPVDVADPDQVEELARRVLDEFGAVHVLCNNAGVNSSDEPIWEISRQDWERVIDINLRGVIHGIRTFLPHMLEQDSEGFIVNTASAAGLGSRPGISPYVATKHAVIALSESLHHDLVAAGSKLRAAVLCPGRIRTPMMAEHLEREGKDVEQAAAGYLLRARSASWSSRHSGTSASTSSPTPRARGIASGGPQTISCSGATRRTRRRSTSQPSRQPGQEPA